MLRSQSANFPHVLAFAAVVAILNLVVVTVLGAVLAGIYNLAVKATGGVLVGFASSWLRRLSLPCSAGAAKGAFE